MTKAKKPPSEPPPNVKQCPENNLGADGYLRLANIFERHNRELIDNIETLMQATELICTIVAATRDGVVLDEPTKRPVEPIEKFNEYAKLIKNIKRLAQERPELIDNIETLMQATELVCTIVTSTRDGVLFYEPTKRPVEPIGMLDEYLKLIEKIKVLAQNDPELTDKIVALMGFISKIDALIGDLIVYKSRDDDEQADGGSPAAYRDALDDIEKQADKLQKHVWALRDKPRCLIDGYMVRSADTHAITEELKVLTKAAAKGRDHYAKFVKANRPTTDSIRLKLCRDLKEIFVSKDFEIGTGKNDRFFKVYTYCLQAIGDIYEGYAGDETVRKLFVKPDFKELLSDPT